MPRLASLALVLVAGCTGAASRAPAPMPAHHSDTVRVSTDVLAQSAEPLVQQAVQRADLAARLVDTIVVTPDSIVLGIGEVTAIKVEARNAAGEAIPRFVPLFRIEDTQVAGAGPGGITGRRVGRTHLVVRPMVFGQDEATPAKHTRVLVVVRLP